MRWSGPDQIFAIDPAYTTWYYNRAADAKVCDDPHTHKRLIKMRVSLEIVGTNTGIDTCRTVKICVLRQACACRPPKCLRNPMGSKAATVGSKSVRSLYVQE